VKLHDAYLSVHEALKHAGSTTAATYGPLGRRGRHVLEEARRELEQVDGVLVPGGFGSRGWEGRSSPAASPASAYPVPRDLPRHARRVSEFARHVAALDGANSTEMDPETPYPVIDLLPEQKEVEDLGGTMRLGAQAVELADGSARREAYGEPVVHERHRHRYEVNNHFRPRWSRRASSSRARSRRAGWSRSSSCPITHGSSPASSIPSSSHGPRGRRRSSATSSARRMTGRAGVPRIASS
jgi:CTP synthase